MDLGVIDAALPLARTGDREALARLWRAANPALVRYLRGRGAAEPEDLATQTWIDTARQLPTCDGDGAGFRRLLFTVARRRLIDDVRRRARRPEELQAVPPDLAGGATDEVDGSSLDGALALLRRLPPAQAEVLLLRVVADLPVDEVAAVTGRSAGAVRVITHRALERLREICVTPSAFAAMNEER